MDTRELLEQVKSGNVEIEDTQMRLKNLPYEDSGHIKLDHHRRPYPSFGEIVLYQSKLDAYLLEVYKEFYERDEGVLGTRTSESQAEPVGTAVPEMVYDSISRMFKVEKSGKERRGYVTVCTGGTADIPVAGEVAQATEYFGCSAGQISDMGVTGIHRLLVRRERLGKVNCIVTVTGMGDAPGMIIAGSVECPMVAAPTFMGHGASFHGLSALFITLGPCANGVSVANTDNGYGVGYLAAQINKMAVR